jgi:hypothetical protein
MKFYSSILETHQEKAAAFTNLQIYEQGGLPKKAMWS